MLLQIDTVITDDYSDFPCLKVKIVERKYIFTTGALIH